MKLAVATDCFNPKGTDAERAVSVTAEQLAARGHRVTVITGASSHAYGAVAPADIRVLTFCTAPTLLPISAVRFARWARQRLSSGSYDATLSMTLSVPATVLLPDTGTTVEKQARLTACGSNPPVRLVRRFMAACSLSHQQRLGLERQTLRDPIVKQILVENRYIENQLRTHHRVDRGWIRRVRPAVNVPPVTPEQKRDWGRRIRQGFQVHDGAVVYLYAAEHHRLGGADHVLRATRRVLDHHENTVLLLAGPLGYAQQHLAAELGIREQVRFVATTARMAELYAAADITVSPTYFDPSGRGALASLAVGTPVITTPYSGAVDLVRPHDGSPPRGRVIHEPGDEQALAEAMIAMANPGASARYRQACRGLAESLSIRHHIDRLESTLLQAAESSP